MLMRYPCLRCGQRIKVDIDLAGEMLGCPVCGYQQQVPPPTQNDIDQALAELRAQKEYGSAAVAFPSADGDIVVRKNKTKKVRTLRGSLYIFMILASLPLFLGVLFEDKTTIDQRIEKTLAAMPRKDKERAAKVFNEYRRDEAEIEEVLQVLPDKRLTGAWQPLYSKWHYYLTGLAAVVYLILLGLLLPEGFSKFHVKIGIMLFTGVAGIALLYCLQIIAISGRGVLVGGPFGILFGLIGLAYRLGDMPDVSFGTLLMANIFGVGLCEELIKALPVFVMLMGRSKLKWHECCGLGLASGLGFGIVEALDYGQRFHGIYGELEYWIRFVSCIVSHGVSTGAAALMVHRYQSLVQGEMSIGDAFVRLLLLIAVPMVLHGLYNTLLTKDMDGMALAVDLMNFAWLAIMIETARDRDGDKTIEVMPEAAPA